MAEAIAALKEVERRGRGPPRAALLGELLIASGKRGEASAPLMTLIEDYNDDKITATDAEGLALVGRAAHLLRSAARRERRVQGGREGRRQEARRDAALAGRAVPRQVRPGPRRARS